MVGGGAFFQGLEEEGEVGFGDFSQGFSFPVFEEEEVSGFFFSPFDGPALFFDDKEVGEVVYGFGPFGFRQGEVFPPLPFFLFSGLGVSVCGGVHFEGRRGSPWGPVFGRAHRGPEGIQ